MREGQSGESHWDLKMFPWDRRTPRFYPPGQHPALAQHRELLGRCRELAERGPHSQELDEMIAYLEGFAADFEARESELKALEHGRRR